MFVTESELRKKLFHNWGELLSCTFGSFCSEHKLSYPFMTGVFVFEPYELLSMISFTNLGGVYRDHLVFVYSKYFLVYTVQWSAIKVLS